MTRVARITTLDNPFDPFDEFDEWYLFDEAHGYHTCAYLGRIVRSSSELSDADQAEANETAIDEIIEINGDAVYRKIVREID